MIILLSIILGGPIGLYVTNLIDRFFAPDEPSITWINFLACISIMIGLGIFTGLSIFLGIIPAFAIHIISLILFFLGLIFL